MKNEFILVIDRVEGDLAICMDECEKTFVIPVSTLAGMGEGDCFLAEDNGGVRFVRALPEETARRKAQADSMLAALFSKNKG